MQGRDVRRVINVGNTALMDDGTIGIVKSIDGNVVVVTTEAGDVVVDLTVSNLEMQA